MTEVKGTVNGDVIQKLLIVKWEFLIFHEPSDFQQRKNFEVYKQEPTLIIPDHRKACNGITTLLTINYPCIEILFLHYGKFMLFSVPTNFSVPFKRTMVACLSVNM